MEGSILHCYRGHREKILGILYLFKCPVPFINVTIYLVSHLLVIYNLFGSLNVVESHIKSSQSDLALYKYWVTHSFWLWLFTDVAIVMNITNCWKLFRYGVKIDYYEKWFVSDNSRNKLILVSSIIFLQITPGLWKNIPLLDEVDGGDTVSTICALYFSSSNYCFTQGRAIYDLNLNSASFPVSILE